MDWTPKFGHLMLPAALALSAIAAPFVHSQENNLKFVDKSPAAAGGVQRASFEEPATTLRLLDEPTETKAPGQAELSFPEPPVATPDGAPAVPAPPLEEEPPARPPAAQPAQPIQAEFELSDPAPTNEEPASPQVSVSEFLKQLAPGKTTAAELLAVTGKPTMRKTTIDGEKLIFRAGPFATVTAFVADDLVYRVVGDLVEPQPVSDFRREWNLTDIPAAIVPDSHADAAGQAFPERGVLVYFKENVRRPLVTQVDIRPVSAQPFLWRMQYGYEYGVDQRMRDLESAAAVDPRNPETHWLRADLLLEIERPAEALQEVEAALAASGETPRYRLTKGRALAQLGRTDAAIAELRNVAESRGATSFERALAEAEWGKLTAVGESPDYPASMKHHQKAIEWAAQASREYGPMASRKIQEALIEAHFGGALAVAVGPWKGGDQAARQWIAKANSFVKMYVETEKGDPAMLLKARRQSIAILERLSDDAGAGEILAQAESEAEPLIADAPDETRRKQIEWELAQVYFRGARMLRREGKMEQVNKYYTKAYEIIRQQEEEREASPAFNYFLGNVHFFAGSLYAVNHNNHEQAMPIYQRALEYYSLELGPGMQAEAGRQGERYVSMGVTYWQAGQREQAIKLSEAGLQLMEMAARRREIPREDLAVPYGNLAHMKSAVGDKESAAKLMRVADQLGKPVQR